MCYVFSIVHIFYSYFYTFRLSTTRGTILQVPETGDGTAILTTGTHHNAFQQLDQRAPDAIDPIMDYVYSTWTVHVWED